MQIKDQLNALLYRILEQLDSRISQDDRAQLKELQKQSEEFQAEIQKYFAQNEEYRSELAQIEESLPKMNN